MTCGKLKHLDGSLLSLRHVFLTAVAVTLTIVCLLLAGSNTAQGQAPTSVLDLVPEAVRTPPTAGPAIELTHSTARDPIAVAPQDTTIGFVESGSFVDSFDAPPETLQYSAPAVTQSIQLRKNVLGCQASYHVLPQDEVWIVSARECSGDPENVGLIKVRKLENNCWQESSLNALSDSHLNDTRRTTMLYVHGNQTNYEYGVSRGFQFYNNLFVKYTCPRPAVRLVLWLWQSEREVRRLYPDYIMKSRRAVTMGKTLTKTLEALGNRKLALVGFSLGAQVVLSSLEQMEPQYGRSLGGASQRSKYNVAIIAPATDPDYICDVIGRNVQSTIVHQSMVIVNPDDRAVKAMRFVIRHECPEAHGDFCDLARCGHLPLGETEFFEISQEICRKHSIERYTRSPTTRKAMVTVLSRAAASPTTLFTQFSPVQNDNLDVGESKVAVIWP